MNLTTSQMEALIAQSAEMAALSDTELMKKVTQYAVKHTEALSDERAFLVEAALRLEKLAGK